MTQPVRQLSRTAKARLEEATDERIKSAIRGATEHEQRLATTHHGATQASAGGSAGGVPGDSGGTTPTPALLTRLPPVTVPDGTTSDPIVLGGEVELGCVKLFYGVDRGSLQGAGEVVVKHDGATARIMPTGDWLDNPEIDDSVDTEGWAAALSGGNLQITVTLLANGDDAIFYFAFFATERP